MKDPSRALVVEDDPSWQQILTEILTDCGLQVDVCADLQASIGRLRASPYRLALVDLSLSGADHANQDGLEVLAAIRRYAPTCHAIMLTGFASVELAVSVLQDYGAYTCLRKETFRRAAFRDLVREALADVPFAEAHALPVTDISVVSGVSVKASLARPPTGSSVLVIEDDAGWQTLLADLLGEAGYTVVISSSFGDAIGRLKHSSFALAVADLSLASSIQPDDNLDGYRLLAYTQKFSVPTIVVSGVAKVELIEQAYSQHQIYACLEKQAFQRQVFLDTVREAAIYRPHNPEIAQLSTRELDVLTLVVRGLTNKEIAAHLYITTNTVKRHLKSIFAKLNVNTRAAASAIAVQWGLGVDLNSLE